MLDHRIKQRPATTCEDFDIVEIRDYASTKQNTNKISECDCFLPSRYYRSRDFVPRIVRRWEDLKNKFGFGFIIKRNKEQVIKVLSVIDWRCCEFASVQRGEEGGMGGFSKSDIIAAYNDFLRNEKWHIDYINHYEKHKCKTTE